RAHVEVLVEEPPRLQPVGADPADDGGEVHDDFGSGVGVEANHVGLARQVVLGPPRRHDIIAAFPEQPGNVPAAKTAAAGDGYARARHRSLSSPTLPARSTPSRDSSPLSRAISRYTSTTSAPNRSHVNLFACSRPRSRRTLHLSGSSQRSCRSSAALS